MEETGEFAVKNIAIIGSYNQDVVFRAQRIPAVGETLQGISYFSDSGGKGSNQTIAAHLQGAQITPVLKLGDDAYGQQAKALYRRLGIPLGGVFNGQPFTYGRCRDLYPGGRRQQHHRYRRCEPYAHCR